MRETDHSTSASAGAESAGPTGPRRFTLPQFGIFAQGTHAHHFLEFDLNPDVTPRTAVAAFRLLRAPDVSAGGVNLVVAFGSDAWRDVAPSMAPDDLGPFEPLDGRDGRRAPATQHDAWLWISGAEPDVTWQSAHAAVLAVADAAHLATEQQAFTYLAAGTSRALSTGQPTRRFAAPLTSRSSLLVMPERAAVTC